MLHGSNRTANTKTDETVVAATAGGPNIVPVRLGDFAADIQKGFCESFCQTPQVCCTPNLIFDLMSLARGQVVVLGYAPSVEAFKKQARAVAKPA